MAWIMLRKLTGQKASIWYAFWKHDTERDLTAMLLIRTISTAFRIPKDIFTMWLAHTEKSTVPALPGKQGTQTVAGYRACRTDPSWLFLHAGFRSGKVFALTIFRTGLSPCPGSYQDVMSTFAYIQAPQASMVHYTKPQNFSRHEEFPRIRIRGDNGKHRSSSCHKRCHFRSWISPEIWHHETTWKVSGYIDVNRTVTHISEWGYLNFEIWSVFRFQISFLKFIKSPPVHLFRHLWFWPFWNELQKQRS